MTNIEHLPRWVIASIATWVEARRDGVLLYVEGQDRKKLDKVEDFIELRVDGPHMVQQTNSDFDFYVEVSLLINSRKDGKDAYKMARLLGKCLKALSVCIPVLRLGEGTVDDKSQVGVLQRMESPKDPLDVASFGQIEPTQPNEQGTCVAQYVMCYSEE